MRDPGPGPKYNLPSTVGRTNPDPTRHTAPGYSFGSRYSYQVRPSPGPYYLESGVSNRGKANNTGVTITGRPRNSFWEKSRDNDQPVSRYEINRSTTEKSSPSYSFGSPRRQDHRTEGPGPIYNIPSTFGKGPAAGIYGRNARQSFHHDNQNTPAPTYYEQTNQNRGFTIGRRTRLPGNNDVTPGPIYDPPMNGNSPRSPRFHFGIKHHEDKITMIDVSD